MQLKIDQSLKYIQRKAASNNKVFGIDLEEVGVGANLQVERDCTRYVTQITQIEAEINQHPWL